jgi:hypothetical protein
MIAELGVHLRKANDLVNSLSSQLREAEDKYGKQEDERIAKLEDLISTLRVERTQQENVIAGVKQQVAVFAADKEKDRKALEQTAAIKQEN